jgi:predicted RNase H-like HicB family nuclease
MKLNKNLKEAINLALESREQQEKERKEKKRK